MFNNGTGPTSGAVTIVDTLPAGLVPVDAIGDGWSCAIAAQAVTCSRSDVLAADGRFPRVLINTDVAANAASTRNQARVDGGGDTTPDDNVATDDVAISPPNQPNLTIAKRHDGDFRQGHRVPPTSCACRTPARLPRAAR